MIQSVKTKQAHPCACYAMRWEGVEPSRLSGTWPSTTPVCQFQHQRQSRSNYILLNGYVKNF